MFNLKTVTTYSRHILLKPSRLRKFTGFHANKKSFANGPRNVESSGDSKKYIGLCSIIPMLGLYYYFTWDNRKALSHHASNKPQYNPGDFVEGLKLYSAEEVSRHNDKAIGIWVTYKRGVYDITDFIEKHPGGPDKIIMAAGGSIEPFWMIFSNHKQNDIYDLLESMRIGNISETDSQDVVTNMEDPYANEPSRNKILIINNKKPFNAETPASLLVESYHTASDLFYVRNHLPVPEVDPKTYELELLVENDVKKILKLEDIKKFPKYTVDSTIMCAGNRRSEMAQVKPVQGLSWGVGAVGNATWSGARLRDLLMDLNINEEDYNHVQFEGLDLDPSGAPYGTSIPIRKAMDPRGDVLLAYEMNGEPLSRDHGFPIRVVVPGVVGARNVKWLGKIVVSKHESDSQWQQRDYKGFSPSTDWNNVDFSKSPAVQELPVISAICIPGPGEKVKVKNGKITVKGYAWSGGGQKIIRVDVTTDRGTTWETADFVAQDSAKPGCHWGWTIWQAELPVRNDDTDVEIWSKAVDSSYNVQPESTQNIWNLRGILNNAYHKVAIEIRD